MGRYQKKPGSPPLWETHALAEYGFTDKEAYDILGGYHPLVAFNRMYPSSLRFRLFLEKGHQCVHCGIWADRIIVWQDLRQAAGRCAGEHRDLFATNILTGRPVLITMDHIIPEANGGLKTLENLQPLCEPCNVRKGSRSDEEAKAEAQEIVADLAAALAA